MRILVGNDDGYEAPGIRLLAEAALTIGPEVWVVAPDRKWTAASHQLSFDRDLTLTRTGERAYACSGAPADCVVAAMTILFADGPKPDVVFAGINDKRNVAEDVAYSGTTAIAREATFWGVPAISLSSDKRVGEAPAERTALSRLLRAVWQSRDDWAANGHWLSVNLPASLSGPIALARVGRDKIASACDVIERTPERITYRNRRERPGTSAPGDENSQINAGRITVVRHCWLAAAEVPEGVVAAWNKAVV